MASVQTEWQIAGDYFENCNCDVVCPCLFSTGPPLSAKPTQGPCEVALAFHIDRGNYSGVRLDGLNVVVVMRTPGPMGEGNWSVGAYIDERGDAPQREALQAIFTGAAGGPVAAFGPLISTVLGIKAVPISWHKEGKRRSVEVPGVMRLAVHAAPSLDPENEIWALNAHPFSPQLALAVGDPGSTFADYGMHWDNSGKNGHYASINWSNR